MMLKKVLIIGMIVGVLGWLFTSMVQAASPPRQGEGREYVVQADDSLSQLAEKYFGDANLWPRIVEATNTSAAADPRLAVINNPNVIYPGQIIFIPAVSPMLS
ncbi:MAG TPA: LysM peptidoglycan-binding domain-containing protein, partial [Anaerolineae bacterium]|nr:LysM peptidoglycan-binding domain-containing protein [Anaerolineae bacterium]